MTLQEINKSFKDFEKDVRKLKVQALEEFQSGNKQAASDVVSLLQDAAELLFSDGEEEHQ